jgi:hypothetical protein
MFFFSVERAILKTISKTQQTKSSHYDQWNLDHILSILSMHSKTILSTDTA